METVKAAMNHLEGNEYPEKEGSPLSKKNDKFLICFFLKSMFAVYTVSLLLFKIKFYLYANATGLYTYTQLVNVGLVWSSLFCLKLVKDFVLKEQAPFYISST